MATLVQLRNLLYTWASTESGLETIWAEQNFKRPAKPYVSLKIVDSDTSWNNDEYVVNARGVNDQIHGIREVMIAVQIYGTDLIQNLDDADTLRSSIRSKARQLDFINVATFKSTSEVLDTSYKLDGFDWERRAEFTLDMWMSVEHEVSGSDSDYIERHNRDIGTYTQN